MKKLLLSLSFACCFIAGYAQELSETDKLASLCRIWGFLKYFHPVVAQSNEDWDQVFISQVYSLSDIHSRAALNSHYCSWIAGLGDVKSHPVQPTTFDTTCNFNRSLSWIDSNNLFSPELSALLKEIVTHRCVAYRHFVRRQSMNGAAIFKNEKEYPDLVFPAKEYRMLALARYWNMIEYFYPYKYLTDKPWDDVLTEFVPKLCNAKDTLAYARSLARLVASENDSHSNLVVPAGIKNNACYLPVILKVFTDKAIVTEIVNDSLAQMDDLQIGDVIFSINDTSIGEWIRHKRSTVGASNEAVIRRNLRYSITSGHTRLASVRVDRAGTTSTKPMTRYTPAEINFKKPEKKSGPSYKTLADNIGYVDMGLLKKKEIKTMVRSLKETKAIIFDLRNYPNFIVYPLCNYLATEKTPFAQFLEPDYSYPGKYLREQLSVFGKTQDARYKGKIIILVNEVTQSRAEFTAMGLGALANSTIIGSQTAGADGNAVNVVLPGGYKFIISGLGVYYPDGRQTQRTGIKPEIYIEPTVEGIRAKRDEVLERALVYVTSGN